MNTRNELKKEAVELLEIAVPWLLVLLPGVIAYYFCRDYPGRGNSPQNAPMAAVVVVFVWTPFYLFMRSLFVEHQWKFDIAFLIFFSLLVWEVTLNNPKF